MKKNFLIFISLSIILCIFGFISCESDINNLNNQNIENNTGKISGKVVYSNLGEANHGGIIVTLDKTDGLMTNSVREIIESKSVKSFARSIVGTELTTNDGTYFFDNLEPGTYTVYASSAYSKEKAVCTNVVVRSAEETIAEVLKLTATGSISGKVTLDNKTTGNIGFLVFVAGTSYMAMTDDAGNYMISDVPAGRGYQLVAMKNSVIHLLETEVVVNANSLTTIATNNFTSKELKSTDGKDGTDGTSIVWLGSFEDESEIESPQYLNAYFNMKDGCSYIYDGTKWTLLSRAGVDGENLCGNLAIGTVLSTEELTNQDVVISINLSKNDIASIGYIYSSKKQNWNNAKSVLNSSDFISLSKNSNEKYELLVSENGYYTIAVKDSDGFFAYSQLEISNIDKNPTEKVENFSASYSKITKRITITWNNPSDNDFVACCLSYTKNKNIIVSDETVKTNIFLIDNVEVNGDVYDFSIYAIDLAGNSSSISTVSITPSEDPSIQAISLSRYHLAYNDPDQKINVVVTLNNAELIEDGTIIKIQTKDGQNITNSIANLDKTNGTATAEINVPNNFYNKTSNGVTYTVLCKIGDAVADTTHIAQFNVSAGATLHNISQSLDGDLFNKEKLYISLDEVSTVKREIVRIEGYNLDLTTANIQLYDSFNQPVFSEPIIVDKKLIKQKIDYDENDQIIIYDDNYQIVDTFVSIPRNNENYKIVISFDGEEQIPIDRNSEEDSKETILIVYDKPIFSSFYIPLASYTREDSYITAHIIGKNFNTPGIDYSKFKIESNNSTVVSNLYRNWVRIENDNLMDVTFLIPGKIGEYTVEVSYELNSITGILKVGNYDSYSIGDVLLEDGTIISYSPNNMNFTDVQKQKAIGILYGFNEYDAPIGYLGLYNSSIDKNQSYYQWANNKTLGGEKKIMTIICRSFNDEGTEFIGDVDGKDNWSYICSADPVGIKDAKNSYPAFYYANNYAETFCLAEEFAEGWYIPTYAELCFLSKNTTIINSVINALKGVPLSGSYWSSSQCDSHYYDEEEVYLFDTDGGIYSNYKYEKAYVCCVRPFE